MADTRKLRLVFMGTPEFAAIVLDALLQNPHMDLAAVYTQPDRPAGRGMREAFSPVKQLALQNRLPVLQPPSLRGTEEASVLAAFAPDFLVVAAYGLILPQSILDVPRFAPINVHASLLPRYRGAAPVQRAIMENWQADATTGVSIMRMTAGLDTGPVYAMATLPIGNQTAGALQKQLASLGGELLGDVLEKIYAGALEPKEQDETQATYAHKLQKSDGIIDWARPVREVDALIRAVTPWPGARTTLAFSDPPRTLPVTILSGAPGPETGGALPGQIARVPDGLAIACSDNWFVIGNLIPQGKKPTTSGSLANGYCRGKNGLCGRTQ